ncbi:MAG: hypothetical protein ACOY3X_09715 [Pseudomonadota bacterium]
MAVPARSRWHALSLPVSLLLLLSLVSPAHAAPAGARPAGIGTDTETVEEGEAEFDEIEALKAKAAQEGDWGQSKEDEVKVNERIFTKTWNKAPFGSDAFDMTPEQIQANWGDIMRAIRVPYPSPEYLRTRSERFPVFKQSVPNFNGDYEELSRNVINVWRLFFRGDFQEAEREGDKYGVAGMIPGKVSQMIYAVYLEPNLADKHMLLQDVANTVREYSTAVDQMKKEKQFQADYIILRVGYSYSIGRIAEDVPIPVAIGRNYVFKLLGATNDILELDPDNPLGLAFRAGIDANVVRKVGKATGRVTFGAKQTNVKSYFDRVLKDVPDWAILRYEYANALLYMDKKRQIDEALAQFQEASKARPRIAMEALDAMYAAKRRKEVEALSRWSGSFRSFERKRLKYQKDNNINLYCVLPKVCPAYIIQ